MATRERVHDLGGPKAVVMIPPKTVTMVICWVIAPAVIALPAGLAIAIAGAPGRAIWVAASKATTALHAE